LKIIILFNNKSKVDIWVFKTAKFEAFNYYRDKRTEVDRFEVADANELEIIA